MGAQKRKKKSLLYGPAAWWWEMQEKLERERGKGSAADKKGEETLCRIWKAKSVTGNLKLKKGRS